MEADKKAEDRKAEVESRTGTGRMEATGRKEATDRKDEAEPNPSSWKENRSLEAEVEAREAAGAGENLSTKRRAEATGRTSRLKSTRPSTLPLTRLQARSWRTTTLAPTGRPWRSLRHMNATSSTSLRSRSWRRRKR